MKYGNGSLSEFLAAALVALVVASSSNAQTRPPGLPPPPPAGQQDSDDTAEINVKNADIAAILRIFSRKTKRNYILDERVRGKVTMYLPAKISPDESLKILDSVLALKGFTTVPIGENLYKVVPSKEARQSTVPTLSDDSDDEPASGAVITKLLTLKYVSAEEVQPLLTQLISPDGFINAYAGTNSLILIDYQDNIERLQRLITELDVPFSDRDMTIIPIIHADAEHIAEKLKELLGTSDSTKKSSETDSPLDFVRARIREAAVASTMNRSPNPGAVPVSSAPGVAPGAGGSSSTAQGGTPGSRAREPKIISDERTNSIIVVADDDTTARIKALISQLDSKVDLSGNRFYVYRCQHANAEDLADVLAGLAGEGGGGSGRSGTTGSSSTTGGSRGGAFGDSGFDNGGDFSGRSSSSSSSRGSRGGQSRRTQDRLSGQSRLPGQSRRDGDTGGGAKSAQLGDNLSITADPATNSLIIVAGKSEYEKIRQLIEKLDIKRRQVLVEATLLEVSVNEDSVLGNDFLTSTGGKDGGLLIQNSLGGAQGLQGLLKDPTALSQFSIAAASAGTLTLPGGLVIPSQAMLLSAAQNSGNVNVLSAPTLLATDNEEAEIVVGQNVPFLASTSTSGDNLNNTFNQIDRQDVGITLRITPQISSEDFVTLKIFTDVSNLVGNSANTLGPTTTVRSSETTVITKDGQMIVIGGLMSDEATDSTSGVPFLRDIPIFGQMFRRSVENKNRRNLLTFITPRIVKDQYDARTVSLDHRDTIERTIQDGDLFPRRKEVLHDPDLDNVTELNRSPSKKPGTILPPVKEPESYFDKDAEQNARQELPVQKEEEPTIELKVSPKLPASSTNSGEASLSRYYVMKIQGDVSLEGLPFQTTEDGQFGIEVPGDTDEVAKNYFQLGRSYTYSIDDKVIVVTPIERYSSPGAPETPSVSQNSWYTLSPYEIMNLGSGPWAPSK